MRKEEKLSPPDEDEFETAGLEARPSREINASGIAGCYS
jgi:flavin reductase (DIM6/NTAB) family NADH-FMN oxidoreductase RutF